MDQQDQSEPEPEHSIKVFCRIRPLLPHETHERYQIHLTPINHHHHPTKIHISSPSSSSSSLKQIYEFSKIFLEKSSQNDIFLGIGQEIIENIQEGYNQTILTYGHTSVGKSYTMHGDKEKKDGLSMRIIKKIKEMYDRNKGNKGNKNIKWKIFCSFFEIYNNKVNDVIGLKKKDLKVYETEDNKVIVKNLTEIEIKRGKEIEESYLKGLKKLKIGETDWNERSSRSHSIFVLKFVKEEKVNINVMIKVEYYLHLVDLAGSERQKSSTPITPRNKMKEAVNINKSILTLGKVIRGLSEKKDHICFRDSKLTHYLKNSLGGSSKTCIIACLSPCITHFDETKRTLQFTSMAKNVKNVVKINELISGDDKSIQKEFQRIRNENKRLKNEILGKRKRSSNHDINNNKKKQKITFCNLL